MNKDIVVIDITKKMEKRDDFVAISGRDFGTKQKKELGIDEAIENNDKVIIRVPKSIYSISSSFFLGMFGDLVRKYGKKEFMRKVSFDCENRTVDSNISDGIFDALNTSAAV